MEAVQRTRGCKKRAPGGRVAPGAAGHGSRTVARRLSGVSRGQPAWRPGGVRARSWHPSGTDREAGAAGGVEEARRAGPAAHCRQLARARQALRRRAGRGLVQPNPKSGAPLLAY